MDKKIYIGTTYYPEHWPRERWAEDIRLMKEAGLNVLRLAESAWAKLEPEDGKFDFQWLDDFIDMVSEENFQIVLGTPIEASPVWLRHKHPEVVRKDEFGRIHAERGYHCKNNSALIYHVNRLVTEMVKHYKDHPNVIGWQIDNELRSVPCYCQECEEAYRSWLKEKYGTIENLNRLWGTTFWSQIYNEWEEIKLPSADQLTKSVSQILDFRRFQSDSTVKHLNRQIDIIKAHAPHHFVTHNSLGLYLWLDLYELAENLEFMSVDSYPNIDAENADTCLSMDLHRSAKRDNFWVMEQKNGYFNYSHYNLAIEPGIVRLWAYQDIARGANGVLFYNWRSTRFSWEQNPNGVLRHDGTPRRSYYEIQQLTNELSNFGHQLAETTVEAPVAILHSYDHIWAYEAHKQYTNFDYRQHIKSYYRALLRMGITPDLLDPHTDLSPYKIVIAPSLMMINDDIYENLQKYVENGGCLIIGARSGMKTWENVTIETPWPGVLSDLAGVTIPEFEVLPDHYANTISYKGKEYMVKVWLDILETKTAESIAIYTKKFYAGRTAISRNSYGKGAVYYVGVMGSDELISDFLADIANEHGLKYTTLPEKVYVTRRVKDKDHYIFYINMSKEQKKIVLEEKGFDLISGKYLSGEVLLNGLDLLLLKRVM